MAAAALVAFGASAQAPRLTMVSLGAGTSCSEWVDAAGNEALEQWAYGFASAIAAGVQLERGTDPLARMDAGRMHEWLDGYCRRNPASPLSVALIRMVFASGQ